jgi:hypothetical protein
MIKITTVGADGFHFSNYTRASYINKQPVNNNKNAAWRALGEIIMSIYSKSRLQLLRARSRSLHTRTRIMI